jgi:hypothetical protein
MDDRIAQLEARIKSLEKELNQSRSSESLFDDWAYHVRAEYKTCSDLREALLIVTEYLMCCHCYRIDIARVHDSYYSVACYKKCEHDVEAKLVCEIIVKEFEGTVTLICTPVKKQGASLTFKGSDDAIMQNFNKLIYEALFCNHKN